MNTEKQIGEKQEEWVVSVPTPLGLGAHPPNLEHGGPGRDDSQVTFPADHASFHRSLSLNPKLPPITVPLSQLSANRLEMTHSQETLIPIILAYVSPVLLAGVPMYLEECKPQALAEKPDVNEGLKAPEILIKASNISSCTWKKSNSV